MVVPSIFLDDEYEVWGFAVNEAMSAGKPVIATKAVGAAYDLIQNGRNGFVVPEKNPEAICVALRNILDDSSKQQEMGERSLSIINKDFNYENMTRGFEQAINYIFSGSTKKE